jgi:hypothetical protein
MTRLAGKDPDVERLREKTSGSFTSLAFLFDPAISLGDLALTIAAAPLIVGLFVVVVPFAVIYEIVVNKKTPWSG